MHASGICSVRTASFPQVEGQENLSVFFFLKKSIFTALCGANVDFLVALVKDEYLWQN